MGADGQENIAHRELLRIFDKVVIEVKEQLKQEGREDEFVGAKVCPASHPTAEVLI